MIDNRHTELIFRRGEFSGRLRRFYGEEPADATCMIGADGSTAADGIPFLARSRSTRAFVIDKQTYQRHEIGGQTFH